MTLRTRDNSIAPVDTVLIVEITSILKMVLTTTPFLQLYELYNQFNNGDLGIHRVGTPGESQVKLLTRNSQLEIQSKCLKALNYHNNLKLSGTATNVHNMVI